MKTRLSISSVIPYFLLLLLWSFYFLKIGTLFSGFHDYDDHEFLMLVKNLHSSGIWNTIFDAVKYDIELNLRFRPLYIIIRVIESYFFGYSFLVWSIFIAVLAISSSLLFFNLLKKIQFNTSEALVLTLLLIIGEHSTIWWRLGTAEVYGLFLFIFAMFTSVLASTAKKKNFIYSCLFVITIVLLLFIKENFIFVIPGLVFWGIYIDIIHSKNSFKDIFCKKISLIIFSLIIFFSTLAYLKFIILGSSVQGYSQSYMILNYQGIFTNLLKFKYYIFLPLLLLIFSLSIYDFNKKLFFVIYSRDFFIGLFTSIMLIAPQILIYSNSGISERYMCPAIIGIIVFHITLIKLVKNMIKNMDEINKFELFDSLYVTKSIFFAFYIFIFVLQAPLTFQMARDFVIDGDNLKNLFDRVNKDTERSNYIVIVGDLDWNYQWLLSLSSYFDVVLNKKNVITVPIKIYSNMSQDSYSIKLRNDYIKRYKTIFNTEEIKDKDIKAIIFVLGNNEIIAKSIPFIDFKKYKEGLKFGKYIYYSKK